MNQDQRPITISDLASNLGLGRARIYEDIRDGYSLEYPALKRTSISHYLDWHRNRPLVDQLPLEQEQDRQRTISGKSHEPQLIRGSHTVLRAKRKHSPHLQPV